MNTLVRVFSACVLIAAVALLCAQRIPAAASGPSFSFGMAGLAMATTARLNAVNIVRAAPPVAIAQLPCRVDLDFFDGQNRPLKHLTVDNLGLGRAASLDLTHNEASTPTTGRVEITGVVKVSSTQAFFCSIVPTLEVFDDASGRTLAILTEAPAVPVIVPRNSRNQAGDVPADR